MTFERERTVAIEAATAGSAAIADASGDLRGAAGTDAKENVNDLVTAFDRDSQAAVVDAIESSFPSDRIVAEEESDAVDPEPTGEGREWIVDPIDGTANFATGFPYFCVSVALRIDGDSVVGCVLSSPTALGRCWYAVRDEGAFVTDGVGDIDPEAPGGRELTATSQDALEGAVTFARLSERDAERRRIDAEVVETLMDGGSKYRRTGSAALNLCQVAAGHADGYVVLSLQPWDIAAGTLLVSEAGGAVRTRPARVEDDSVEVVASNGPLQARLESLVDERLE